MHKNKTEDKGKCQVIRLNVLIVELLEQQHRIVKCLAVVVVQFCILTIMEKSKVQNQEENKSQKGHQNHSS